MSPLIFIDKIKSVNWSKHKIRIQELVKEKPLLVGMAVIAVLLLLNFFTLSPSTNYRIIESSSDSNFQKGRILSDSEGTFYRGKEKALSQKAQNMIETQSKLQSRLDELEKRLSNQVPAVVAVGSAATVSDPKSTVVNASPGPPESSIQVYPAVDNFEGSNVKAKNGNHLRSLSSPKGPDLIAFPVKAQKGSEGLVLPAGSYVKAKILTGVDVPEGKTYPVLMVLDFSYIAPNDHKVDLSGCFMIAKAEGDLSTERVQMQATKMSCVSKKGKMFEREVNGFIADDKDGSFAMKGKVQSKQGRVAAMAFLSGVVEGVGKAVQSAQTTQSTNAFGGGQSSVTGDSEKYMIAGGASNAASMVAQWYLKQAQSLSPTVSISSGRDVWIVMKDKVKLPEEFFMKDNVGGPSESIYSYFTRILD